MIVLISPAKKMSQSHFEGASLTTFPEFTSNSKRIIRVLKKFKPADLADLMKVNLSIAEQNHQRFAVWTDQVDSAMASPALLAFKGDVYRGIDAVSYDHNDFSFAQKHVRILSGLYGILKPMDLILPYRLEMGTKIKVDDAANLYQFWSDQLTQKLKDELKMQKSQLIVNLASKEYSKAIDFNEIDARVITPNFKEYKDGNYKFFSVFGKYARGLMVSWLVKNKLCSADDIKLFEEDAYYYNDRISKGDEWYFTRVYGKK